jgi:hypothetical protein
MCADVLRVFGGAVKKQEPPHAIQNGHHSQHGAHAMMASCVKMDPRHVKMFITMRADILRVLRGAVKKQEAPHTMQNGHYSQHGAHAMMASCVKMDPVHLRMYITMHAEFLCVCVLGLQ